MSNIKANNYLINLDWETDIFVGLDGKYNEDKAGKIFVYLFYSMREILKNNGEQVFSGDPSIDYPVKNLINQIRRMRGEQNTVSDLEIAQMRIAGLKSDEISDRLQKLGIKLGSSGVRARDGWKNYQNYANFDNVVTVDNFDKNDIFSKF